MELLAFFCGVEGTRGVLGFISRLKRKGYCAVSRAECAAEGADGRRPAWHRSEERQNKHTDSSPVRSWLVCGRSGCIRPDRQFK